MILLPLLILGLMCGLLFIDLLVLMKKTSQLIGFSDERFGYRITLQKAREIFAAEYKASDRTIDHMQHEEPAVDVRFLLADLRLMHRRLAPEILKP